MAKFSIRKKYDYCIGKRLWFYRSRNRPKHANRVNPKHNKIQISDSSRTSTTTSTKRSGILQLAALIQREFFTLQHNAKIHNSDRLIDIKETFISQFLFFFIKTFTISFFYPKLSIKFINYLFKRRKFIRFKRTSLDLFLKINPKPRNQSNKLRRWFKMMRNPLRLLSQKPGYRKTVNISQMWHQ